MEELEYNLLLRWFVGLEMDPMCLDKEWQAWGDAWMKRAAEADDSRRGLYAQGRQGRQ
jgi:hypothetical protein